MIFGILHGIILLDLINVYTALAVHLQFDKCYDEMNVNEYQNYEIKWTGKVIYTTCKMRFHGYNKYAVSNEYRVCIKATTWEISESEATLRYYSSKSNFKEELKMVSKTHFDTKPLFTFDKHSARINNPLKRGVLHTSQKFTRNSFYIPTTQWCSESKEIVDVELVTLPYGHGGLIQLEVWAVVTWDHKKMVSVICGAVSGVIIATIFIAVILYLRAIRKKRKKETTTDIFTITDYNNGEQTKDPDEMYTKRPFSHSSSTQSSESESIALKSEELHSGQSEPTSPPSYNSIVETMLHFVMLIIGIKLVDSDTEYLTFKDCQGPNPKKWRAVNEDKDYQIYWSGNATVPSCQLVFHGWNRAATKELDKYKICIEATTWDIKVSDLYLIYYTGRGLPRETTEDHRYSKGTDPDPTTKWCAESREVVAIRVVTWTWRMEVNLGFITLKVTAIKTHDYTKFVMTIVGPVVGGIIIVSIFIYCCVRSHRKGRREEASINYRNYVAEILRSENNDDSPIPPGRQSPNQQSTEVFPTPTAPPCLEINGSQNIETVGSTSHEVDLPPPSYETIGPAPPTSVPPPSYESVMNKT